jgi:uncharacterized membrane-anchored protein YjiN (DUF445 family)
MMKYHVKDELAKELALKKMRRFATLLLVLMLGVFFATTYYAKTYPWLNFLKAFSEAAIVGALADWFAVTALFRYPFGLRLPHTAIIPTNKDRIGDSLGAFVQENFLTPEAVRDKLRTIDIAGRSADWLSNDANVDRAAEELSSFIPKALVLANDEEVSNFLKKNIVSGMRSVDLAPLLGDILTVLTSRNKHHALFDRTLVFIRDLFEKYKPDLQTKITKESNWFILLLDGDTILYNKIVSSIRESLDRIASDPDHELRKSFNEGLRDFIEKLKTSQEYMNKVEEIREEILQNPVLNDYLEKVWADIKKMVLADVGKPDSRIKARMKATLSTIYTGMLADPVVRERVNVWIQNAIINTIGKHRNEISGLISGKVKQWDSKTLTGKLELEVGKDLQYIRINGTVIGGCIGLLIYLVTLLL